MICPECRKGEIIVSGSLHRCSYCTNDLRGAFKNPKPSVPAKQVKKTQPKPIAVQLSMFDADFDMLGRYKP